MEITVRLVYLCVFMTSSLANAQAPPQRFQAEKFLDMLGSSYGSDKLVFADLLSALHKKMNLDPASQLNSSTSTADGGSNTNGAMAETSASCQEAPFRLGASITYTSDNKVLGSRALYSCESGYKGKSKFIQCLQGGVWSPLTNWDGCIPVDCGPVAPSVQNADSSFSATTFSSEVVYTCQTGYKMNVTFANVTCLETGTWDNPNFACEKADTPPQSMMAALLQSMPGFSGMASQPNTGLASSPSVLPSSINSNNQMAAMFAQFFPQMALSTPAQTTTTTTTTVTPTVGVLPGGFQLPSHLKNLLPNGLSSTSGMRPQDLMTLASIGLGSANPAAAPKDLSQLLGTMNPMSLFGGSMGLNLGGGAGGAAAGTGPGGVPPDPERMAEQNEEMMMRAMMASAMKSMMNPGGARANASNHNPAMDMMTLMALQSGLGGAGGGTGGGGGAGAYDPIAAMLGGMGGGAGGGMFGSLFGQA